MTAFLLELKSPFVVAKENKGIFVADTTEVLSWLHGLVPEGPTNVEDLLALLCKKSISESTLAIINSFYATEAPYLQKSSSNEDDPRFILDLKPSLVQ
eukprot:CAMPEP_0196571982 /NCGR_PEP_ID=MMETSP1081-20130531/2108_1 /TAXON_ID=36882 /ORGANISM="Pyramimonas amylifera, Strain CCMP720" /LENGTH=97 /DNA_ID=CAMNT_0041889133 /DNA_START=89 /DNA_END=385 /DNA_ORIENTATION=+